MRRLKITAENCRQITEMLANRGETDYSPYQAAVEEILEEVRRKKDEALFAYTEKFDHVRVDASTVRVSEKEIGEGLRQTDEDLLSALRRSAANIRAFHEKQKKNTWLDTSREGILLGQRYTPVGSCGVYVPGGKAAYPSSVMMNVIPAKVAGVERIVMVTPPGKDGRIEPHVLAAAAVCGVDEIYRIGGAQAIAALAYGTESVPRVDKITGPGNVYVALAKRAVFGRVGLDSVAGPSEITVLADRTARAGYVAADLMSQAEHDEMASAILVTTSEELLEEVEREIERQILTLPRREIIEKSLDRYGLLLLADDLASAAAAVNAIAPEHLEIQTEDPFAVMTKIRNAGAIFLGAESSEPLGDYYAGPNHILPTSGTARFFSPLSVDDFMKKTSLIYYTRPALEAAADTIIRIAEAEGLEAHAASVRIRREEGD